MEQNAERQKKMALYEKEACLHTCPNFLDIYTGFTHFFYFQHNSIEFMLQAPCC